MEINCKLCNSKNVMHIKSIDKKPSGETDYKISIQDYKRDIFKCNNCEVFFNVHDNLIPEDFYSGQYNSSIQEGNILERFNRIINFKYKNSDNKNRVLRIVNFLYKNDYLKLGQSVLDVGSGTSVFLHEMRKFGFITNCIDPDIASVNHALSNVKVSSAHNGSLDSFNSISFFDLITFNKVLEHVENPISMLNDCKRLLHPNGIVYVELPNSIITEETNSYIERSEFFIDHNTIFNRKSIIMLAELSELNILEINEVIEPSGKHSIYMFLSH